jgi:hypothetical protein
MRRTCLGILVAMTLLMCGLFDCGYAWGKGAAGSDAVLGRKFKIKYGQELTLEGQELKVKFASLLDDSRCPADVTCHWAGDAKILIGMRRATAEEARIELHTLGTHSEKYQQYEIRLVALDPYPRTDVERKQSDYVATLLITKE